MITSLETPVICLMGPTASGKTALAMKLADALPVDIVSVDSALVYRGMDIGTAKPDAATLERFPHRLIDIREPEESYSAGDFRRDAIDEVRRIFSSGRIPLLVGGTMLYFRALTRGLAALPSADEAVRTSLDAEAAALGWPALHRRLAEVDHAAAECISVNDSQRIQRALEVYLTSGKTLSEWHADEDRQAASFSCTKVALVPEPRAELHRRVEERWSHMLERGFVDEVRRLRRRPGLTSRSPSMRAVGYRQIWAHLEGQYDLDEATARALAATRQLAKRQMTWLRGETGVRTVNPLEPHSFATILSILGRPDR